MTFKTKSLKNEPVTLAVCVGPSLGVIRQPINEILLNSILESLAKICRHAQILVKIRQQKWAPQDQHGFLRTS